MLSFPTILYVSLFVSLTLVYTSFLHLVLPLATALAFVIVMGIHMSRSSIIYAHLMTDLKWIPVINHRILGALFTLFLLLLGIAFWGGVSYLISWSLQGIPIAAYVANSVLIVLLNMRSESYLSVKEHSEKVKSESKTP